MNISICELQSKGIITDGEPESLNYRSKVDSVWLFKPKRDVTPSYKTASLDISVGEEDDITAVTGVAMQHCFSFLQG